MARNRRSQAEEQAAPSDPALANPWTDPVGQLPETRFGANLLKMRLCGNYGIASGLPVNVQCATSGSRIRCTETFLHYWGRRNALRLPEFTPT
jgi:hypothetical protein